MAEKKKPPELPQGVIACRTPCALEPDVSEANSFSQSGGAEDFLWQPGYLVTETPSFAPRRRRRFALMQSYLIESEARKVPSCKACHSN